MKTDTNSYFLSQRLILYFPVSALVTLFANILQNPQDPRARADVKLMNLVVNFLSMLVSDEENGSVKRMLGICAEFERIAKVVLDKTERESHSRRKRKPHADEDDAINNIFPMQVNGTRPPSRPQDSESMSNVSAAFTPGMGEMPNPLFSPTMLSRNVYSPPQMASGPPSMPGYDPNYNGIMTPPEGFNGFPEGQEPSSNMPSPLNLGAFQQPFVPQDLWQMPMTLEWDWADMTNSGFPTYDQISESVDGGLPAQ